MNDAQEERGKRTYRTPQLVVYGDIREITLTSATGKRVIYDDPIDPDSKCDMRGTNQSLCFTG